MPDATLESIKRTRLALRDARDCRWGRLCSVNVALRKTFDLYANVRRRA